jgi:hypothetical protein
MDKGLKIGLCVLGIGCLIPIVTTFMTLRNKPLYRTAQPEVEGCFVQYTWQEKPVINLEHILIFLEKPENYIAKSGVDMFPPEKTDGYYVLPRAVFYKNGNILASMQKVFRMSKKDVRTWVVIQAKAFPLELSKEHLDELTKLIAAEKDHSNVSALDLGKRLTASKAWQVIIKDVEDKRTKLASGKLDLKPHKKRSDFMR